MRPSANKHHQVIIIGGGPGGLGVAAVLNGWHPKLVFPFDYSNFELQALVEKHSEAPLSLDQTEVLKAGLRPIEFFRSQHHPNAGIQPLGKRNFVFHKRDPIDWLMLTLDGLGGLWNNVPTNQLSLSPGHWMELAPYPMAQFFKDTGRTLDENALIHRDDLLTYYNAFAESMNLLTRIKTGSLVSNVYPSNEESYRFKIQVNSGPNAGIYTADHLVLATGPSSLQRKLLARGQNESYIKFKYKNPDELDGDRVMIIGGGRSSDWAATECYEAGKTVLYIMRQSLNSHMKLIRESLNLPYYKRLAEIIKCSDSRMKLFYKAGAEHFRHDGHVDLSTEIGQIQVRVDHVVVEIGGAPDYGLLKGFPRINLISKKDNYRFQLMQMRTNQATFESLDVPGLYPAGYLSEGTGLSVIGFHCGAYLISGDILRKTGYFNGK